MTEIKKGIGKIVFVLAWALMLCACSDQKLSLSSGEEKYLADFSGQWILFNYWAEWCAPCREEIPQLNDLNELKEISVLGYNYDRITGEALSKQVKNLNIKFQQITEDPASLFDLEPPSSLPVTIVVSPKGEYKRMIKGKISKEVIEGIVN